MNNIRWMQRFSHYVQALKKLGLAVDLAEQRKLSDLEEQGLIQAFEYTHELAWKTMKDFLEYHGTSNLYGSKDASRESFKQELILNGEVWMDMIRDRNLTSHTYNEEVAAKISSAILNIYYKEFIGFKEKMEALKKAESA